MLGKKIEKARPIAKGLFFFFFVYMHAREKALISKFFVALQIMRKRKRANPKRLATILTTLCRTETKKLVFLINLTIFHICENILSLSCGWRHLQRDEVRTFCASQLLLLHPRLTSSM